MKDEEYTALRTWRKTHKKLRLIAAHEDETIVESIERLATEELQRLGIKLEDKKNRKPEALE